jgi:RNA polymerase sigma-70 factor (ECF subfamily)
MAEHDWLAEQFEANRTHLLGVAYRMLGSLGEAEDAVQEAWLRLSRVDSREIENLSGWLTTVVSRVCLDLLRSRKARREESLNIEEATPIASHDAVLDPECEAVLADSVGLALLVVLETLGPAERVAFVLHDMFDLPFDEIAAIVGRSPDATRQLASRARRRVRGGSTDFDADLTNQRRIVDAFLAAAREGNFEALLAVLDPDVVVRADSAAVAAGAADGLRGAPSVARAVAGRAQLARPALVNGAVGIVVAPRGRLLLVIRPTFARGKIVAVDVIAEPERLRQLTVTALGE